LKRWLPALLLAVLVLVPAQARYAGASAPHSPYGGTITVATQADIGGLDPATSQNWAAYNLLQDVYNGLLGYKPDSTSLTPDIAAGWPVVSKDGLTWTFTLRHGVMFQPPVNREVHASDFKYSWERMLNPKTASPGVSFFMDIAGAQEYNAGKAKEVSGIRVLGPYTLQVRLLKPYVPFKYIMATVYAYVVPHEIVDKYPKDFPRHPVGTGPFILEQWVPGQTFVLVRNPHYFHKGLPYLDKVVFNVGVQPSVAILQVQRGETDIPSDEISGLDYVRVDSNPQWRSRIFRVPTVATQYLFMNTQVPPFNNRLVRQAVAMAIDKPRLIKVVTAGLASPTQGILPPLMPCYNPKVKGWPYDPARAKKLLAQAGYPNGFSTTLLAGVANLSQAVPEQLLQRDLARIGIKAGIKTAVSSTYDTLVSTPKAVAIGQNGWTLDYPDPSDFIDPILTSSSAVQGGANKAFYSNPTVDTLSAQADQEFDQAKRCNLYHRAEQIIVNDAPWVPLYTPLHATVVSPRLKRFYMNPIWYEFDFAYYQVSG
jgi:ABC-type transport system substrate-binding protein